MLTHARAIEEGADEVRVEAHGLSYAGTPFKYQAKCLAELRRCYDRLSDAARNELDPLLDRHDCLSPLRVGS